MVVSRSFSKPQLTLTRCYLGRLATTIFSATQRYDIVATLFGIITTLFQHHCPKNRRFILFRLTLTVRRAIKSDHFFCVVCQTKIVTQLDIRLWTDVLSRKKGPFSTYSSVRDSCESCCPSRGFFRSSSLGSNLSQFSVVSVTLLECGSGCF